MSRALRHIILRIYGVFTVTVFAVGALLCVALIAALPGLARRRRVTRRVARGIFFCCGMRLHSNVLEELPQRPHVAVANHASYLDGIVLCAVLPPRYTFVIKREVTRAPLVHFLLRRIGARFVERHNRHKGASDARAMLRVAQSGASLAVFPEGTFRHEPGLQRFRSGAFAAAVAGQQDVVPVTIEGTRAILPAGAGLPRPGTITVTFFPALACQGTGREEAGRLSSATREIMLGHLGEGEIAPGGTGQSA